jgi:hypothetical protein
MLKPLLMLSLALVPAPGAAAETLPVCLHASQTFASRATLDGGLRPDFVASVASERYAIVVHYQDGVDPAYASEMLGYVETAWTREFNEMGFLPPLPDGELGGDARFDVYIVTDLDPGIGGYAGFSGFYDPTPRADAVGYLVINNAIAPLLRRFVVAHELFHASQMAYDWWEDLAFMESSATWITERVFPDDDIYWRYFPFFNAEPYKALDFISIQSPYQYGMGMFPLFLDEKFGGDGSFIRRVWEASAQDDMTNEPDFLDAVESLTGGTPAVADLLREFGVWRLLVGDRSAHGLFAERAKWDRRVTPFMELDVGSAVAAVRGTLVQGMQPLSHAFLAFDRDPAAAATLRIELRQQATGGQADGPAEIVADLVELGADGMQWRPLGRLDPRSGLQLDVERPAGTGEVILILTNTGAGVYDADTSPWTKTPVSYDIAVTGTRPPSRRGR